LGTSGGVSWSVVCGLLGDRHRFLLDYGGWLALLVVIVVHPTRITANHGFRSQGLSPSDNNGS